MLIDGTLKDLLKNHAPKNWQDVVKVDLINYINEDKPLNMVVMAADIRKSTILMKEANNLTIFARAISNYVTVFSRKVRELDGWFDKFTGDGFIAYWPYNNRDEDWKKLLIQVLKVGEAIIKIFNEHTLDILRQNSNNFVKDVGISVGIDAGQTYLVKIASELTIVGRPVVGAVRMVNSSSNPNEIICNVFPGNWIERNIDQIESSTGKKIDALKLYRGTKEYTSQEVYLINTSFFS